jgi:outer membrane protein OmpA-like peptidoglycan-associated protein
MRNILSKAGATLLGALLLVFASEAKAEGPSLQLQGGVAVPTNDPQSTRFDPGFSGMVRPYIGLHPVLDIGPSLSYLALPSTIPGVDTGTALGVGGGVRVKRPHNHKDNTGTGPSAVSPYVAGDLQYIRTDGLDRPGVIIQAGVAVPTGDDRTVWVGPYLAFQQVMTGPRAGFDSTDGRFFGGGLSVEFDPFASKREKKVETPPSPPREEPKKVEPPKKVEKPTKIAEQREDMTLRFEGRVQFQVDSAVIQASQKPILDKAVASLKESMETLDKAESWMVTVEGHASSEGPPEPYNQKLSERRAEAVVEYLKAAGVPAQHLRSEGHSYRDPVADNSTQAGRVANRRAELVLDLTIVRKVKVEGDR